MNKTLKRVEEFMRQRFYTEPLTLKMSHDSYTATCMLKDYFVIAIVNHNGVGFRVIEMASIKEMLTDDMINNLLNKKDPSVHDEKIRKWVQDLASAHPNRDIEETINELIQY